MLTAIVRDVSPSINRCELTHLERRPIDFVRAEEQHRQYQQTLADLGVRVIRLPAEPDLPDSVFVEDPVIVLDEIAIINHLGAESRRPEARSLAAALEPFRSWHHHIGPPATVEGGDVLRMGRKIFVGLTPRTNLEGIASLSVVLAQFGYTVETVEVRGCMHLKSGCSALSPSAILINRNWIDTRPFAGFDLVDVDPAEPGGANVLDIFDTVVMAESFPKTRRKAEGLGYPVRTVDNSELMKAEAALTCCSILFEDFGE